MMVPCAAMTPIFSLMSFDTSDTRIHFAAVQATETNDVREIAIYEIGGQFTLSIAVGDPESEVEPEFTDVPCNSLHQAYAHLVRNLDVPL